jgi:hypothetical protein
MARTKAEILETLFEEDALYGRELEWLDDEDPKGTQAVLEEMVAEGTLRVLSPAPVSYAPTAAAFDAQDYGPGFLNFAGYAIVPQWREHIVEDRCGVVLELAAVRPERFETMTAALASEHATEGSAIAVLTQADDEPEPWAIAAYFPGV